MPEEVTSPEGEEIVGEVPEISPEGEEGVPETTEKETETKTVSFEEFEKIQKEAADIKESLAKEQARRAYAERQLKKRDGHGEKPAQVAKTEDASQKPTADQYDDYDDFVVALSGWESNRRLEEYKKGEIQRSQEQLKADRDKRVDGIVAAETAKDPDFLKKAFIPADMPVGIEELVVESDQFVELALHFGKDPAEAIRIVNLPPVQAAREIGKIEQKLKSTVTPRTETRAPNPTKTVSGKEPVSRRLEDLSMEEYIAERQKVMYGG